MVLRHEIRQSSVIQGTGPGAMTVLQQGLTVIIPGIDAWYRKPNNKQEIPLDCRVIDENLAENLGVEFFAVPPAAGTNPEHHTEFINAEIFPRWVSCGVCKALTKLDRSATSVDKCASCSANGKNWAKNIQVNFVIVCEGGHLDEFPWAEWVHRSESYTCRNPQLKLVSKGSGDLKGQEISCKTCSAVRTLDQTSSTDDQGGTTLSQRLNDSGSIYVCSGSRPWLRDNEAGCTHQVRMILRNASNIYYSAVQDSILVPPAGSDQAVLKDLLEPKLNIYKAKAAAFAYDYKKLCDWLKLNEDSTFGNVNSDDLLKTVKILFPNKANMELPEGQNLQNAIRQPEWVALNRYQEEKQLTVRSVGYVAKSIRGFEAISAVPVLNKTTAQKGFTRLIPAPLETAKGKATLRRNPNTTWLPAVRHVGEGIFFRLDEDLLKTWEKQPELVNRISRIEVNLTKFGHLDPKAVPTPRSVLLHTLAHVLIQEFVVECGYVAAALAERIYSGEDMAGILIYTASADADGTMGGLVEMADPEIFARVAAKAIESARWCSNDPVCMELGKDGQGHHGTNLSACHSCCLIPETACQNFNQGLDRATLIGDLNAAASFTGFFE